MLGPNLCIFTDNPSLVNHILKQTNHEVDIVEYTYDLEITKPKSDTRVLFVFYNNQKLQHVLIKLHKTGYKKKV